jgi:hypothetical protein
MKILWQLAIASALLFAPAVASAQQGGPVNDFLTGGTIDPMATMLKVSPPPGGMVMVHRNGKQVAWMTHSGYVRLKPNREYVVTATRGTSLLYNVRLYARPGLTKLRFGEDGEPRVSYQAPYVYGAPPVHAHPLPRTPAHRAPTRHAPAKRAPVTVAPTKHAPVNVAPAPRTPASKATFKQIVARIEKLDSDRERLAAMKSYGKRYTFTRLQIARLMREVAPATRPKVSRALGA